MYLFSTAAATTRATAKGRCSVLSLLRSRATTTMRAWLRREMASSDWIYWGVTYASILFGMTAVGTVAIKLIGVSPDAEKNRARKKQVT